MGVKKADVVMNLDEFRNYLSDVIADINEYGEANITLAGKPFATSYTVLIDTTISENSKIDWDKVDDIKFKINYSYQDLFPNTSACVSL